MKNRSRRGLTGWVRAGIGRGTVSRQTARVGGTAVCRLFEEVDRRSGSPGRSGSTRSRHRGSCRGPSGARLRSRFHSRAPRAGNALAWRRRGENGNGPAHDFSLGLEPRKCDRYHPCEPQCNPWRHPEQSSLPSHLGLMGSPDLVDSSPPMREVLVRKHLLPLDVERLELQPILLALR